MGELTKAQKALLCRADGNGCSVAPAEIKIAYALEGMGFLREVLFPQSRVDYRITPAGRAALRNHEASE